MAEILFINPITGDIKKRYGLYRIFVPLEVPIGLAYLASFLIKNGHKVEVLDNQVEEITIALLNERLNKNLLMVGITSTSPTFDSACRIAFLIKKLKPSAKIVFGGIHPTLMAEEVLRYPFIDIVVRGEGEITLLELVKTLEKGETLNGIQGISYKKGGSTIHNPDRPYIVDLGQLPFPAREILHLARYRPPLDMVSQYPTMVMITSRGCPYHCIYCASRAVSGYQYRTVPPDKIIEEIGILISKYKAKGIIFWDDNFTFDRNRIWELCRMLVKQKINKRIVWFCSARVDNVDPYLLENMAQAGCWMVSYGLETGVQRLLDLIKKGINLDQSRKAIFWTKKAGIKCRATFMLGLPTETKSESLKTILFAKSLKLHRLKFTLMTPYPGTEIFQHTKDSISHNWTQYDSMTSFTSYKPVYIPEGRKSEEVCSLQRRAMFSFYLRPRRLIGFFVLVIRFLFIRNYKGVKAPAQSFLK